MKRDTDSSAGDAYGLTKANVVAFPATKSAPQKRGTVLTKATVKKLQLPAGKTDGVFWDAELPGFGLRLQGAKRTWIVQFRDLEGASRRVTVGSAAVLDVGEARRLGRRLLVDRQAPGSGEAAGAGSSTGSSANRRAGRAVPRLHADPAAAA